MSRPSVRQWLAIAGVLAACVGLVAMTVASALCVLAS